MYSRVLRTPHHIPEGHTRLRGRLSNAGNGIIFQTQTNNRPQPDSQNARWTGERDTQQNVNTRMSKHKANTTQMGTVWQAHQTFDTIQQTLRLRWAMYTTPRLQSAVCLLKSVCGCHKCRASSLDVSIEPRIDHSFKQRAGLFYLTVLDSLGTTYPWTTKKKYMYIYRFWNFPPWICIIWDVVKRIGAINLCAPRKKNLAREGSGRGGVEGRFKKCQHKKKTDATHFSFFFFLLLKAIWLDFLWSEYKASLCN